MPHLSMKTITLHNGARAFSARLYGPERAPMVVCLHGFPDNADSFRYQVQDFVDAGYQVLTPTMRGYEPSSITQNEDYTLRAMAQDVNAWLDELKQPQVHLVGHDWGAVVAYMVAALIPDRLLSVTTIAVPHPRRFLERGVARVPVQALKSWYMLFNQIPLVSDHIVRRNDFAFIRHLWRTWSPGQTLTDEEWRGLRNTFGQPGVIRATLSYYRQNVSPGQMLRLKPSSADAIQHIRVPNLAITGENDGCIDTRVFDHTVLGDDHPAGFRIERVADAGHFTHQEKPQVLNPVMIDWFRQHERTPG